MLLDAVRLYRVYRWLDTLPLYLYYELLIISCLLNLISLKITHAFHLLLGFAKNQTVFWDFKIRNGVGITKGSDNGDSDN